MSENNPLPFYLQFTAGAIAGVSEICAMYPLDVVKTRLQLKLGNSHSSILDTFKKIIRNEGFFRLYRGLLAPILIEAPKRATKFAANEQYSVIYRKLFNTNELNQKLSVLTGVSAGITEGALIVPFELIKIRMQDKNNVMILNIAIQVGLYETTMDCATKIYRTEGLMAFYKGLEATLWRHAFWNGGYFGTIHYIRQSIPRRKEEDSRLIDNFIAGTIGGTIGTILNTPFDVVKTRIQGDTSTISRSSWTMSYLLQIAKKEGYGSLRPSIRFRSLYKGFTPKVLRLGPGGGILLVVFELVTRWMKNIA
ncbi:mitochondrial carrier [Rozella allomycis CSF55]|uniref:Mitochondrial carrier n=1 Tax=Rozella allomycis (strain CSF55) TaxID=988480 RepID=A0A075AMV0_ROZAC|nr:Mitochondrial substrate/solute carrier domain-containing protein [Rozella allomycis CSF55]RKP22182.1 mitochondrial carrier [Rozella allomycis CSF55]|eukprot:EPZ31003.1 Mitochondrial substrate/solute carrier domain-containing protein [Rozella allomycis CSF55]